MIELHLGDCIEVMRGMEANTIDTCITDPPYRGRSHRTDSRVGAGERPIA